jgi:hypothetical protein
MERFFKDLGCDRQQREWLLRSSSYTSPLSENRYSTLYSGHLRINSSCFPASTALRCSCAPFCRRSSNRSRRAKKTNRASGKRRFMPIFANRRREAVLAGNVDRDQARQLKGFQERMGRNVISKLLEKVCWFPRDQRIRCISGFRLT